MIKNNSSLSEILNKLFILQEPPSHSNFLTLYIPTAKTTKSNILKKLKAEVLTLLKNNNEFNTFSDKFKELFINEILLEVESDIQINIKNIHGIAIFIKLPSVELEIKKLQTLISKNIQIINLPFLPQSDIYLDNAFHLDQLLHLDLYIFNALIAHLDKNECKLYKQTKDSFEYLYTQVNDIREKNSVDNSLKRSSFSDEIKQHAGGEYNQFKRSEDENHDLLLKTLAYIKEYTKREHVDYIVLTHSSSFHKNELEELFLKEFANPSDPKSIIIDKNIKLDKDIEKESLSQIVEMQYKIQKELLSNFENNSQNLYVKNWEQVINAVNNKEVDTLIIRSDIRRGGFINSSGQLSFVMEKGSKKVENILSLIIKNVLEVSGKIIVFTDTQFEDGIAAKLRFVI